MVREKNVQWGRVVQVGHATARSGGSRAPLEQLADESSCPIELILELYERELIVLEREARIRAYIPLLAMKRVRNALRDQPRLARQPVQRRAAA